MNKLKYNIVDKLKYSIIKQNEKITNLKYIQKNKFCFLT
jgi:hypothetical protein